MATASTPTVTQLDPPHSHPEITEAIPAESELTAADEKADLKARDEDDDKASSVSSDDGEPVYWGENTEPRRSRSTQKKKRRKSDTSPTKTIIGDDSKDSKGHEHDVSHEKKDEDAAIEGHDHGQEEKGVHHDPHHHHHKSDIPNEGLDAWLCVAGGWCVSFTSWGYVNAFGVYQAYFATHQLSHKTPSDISWIGAFQLFSVCAGGAFVGRLFDAGYLRYIIFTATIIYFASLMGLSYAKTYTEIFLAQGVGCGAAAGLMFLPAVSAVSQHFTTHRSLALGVLATGSSIGGVIYPAMLNKLLQSSAGFGWTVRASAFLTLGLHIVACLTLTSKMPPRKGGLYMDWKLLKIPEFSLFVFGIFMVILGLYTPMFYMQEYAELHGVDSNLAFYSLSILNAASVFGRIIPNALADRTGPLNVLIPCCGVSSVLIIAWIGAGKSTGGVIAFAIIFGFCSGAYVSLMPAAVAGMTPKDQMNTLGVRMSMLLAGTSFGALTGTPIAGAIVARQKGSFVGAAIFSGVVAMLGTCSMFLGRWILAKKRGTQML